MGTPAEIIVKLGDDQYKAVPVEFDGYLSNMAKELLSNFNDQKKAEHLVSRGMVCSLFDGECEFVPGTGHMFGVGKSWKEAQDDDHWAQGVGYGYMWDGEQWMTHHRGRWQSLALVWSVEREADDD